MCTVYYKLICMCCVSIYCLYGNVYHRANSLLALHTRKPYSIGMAMLRLAQLWAIDCFFECKRCSTLPKYNIRCFRCLAESEHLTNKLQHKGDFKFTKTARKDLSQSQHIRTRSKIVFSKQSLCVCVYCVKEGEAAEGYWNKSQTCTSYKVSCKNHTYNTNKKQRQHNPRQTEPATD